MSRMIQLEGPGWNEKENSDNLLTPELRRDSGYLLKDGGGFNWRSV